MIGMMTLAVRLILFVQILEYFIVYCGHFYEVQYIKQIELILAINQRPFPFICTYFI